MSPVLVSLGLLLALHPMTSLAQPLQDQTAPSGSITELQLPRIADYWVSASLQSGGAIIFDGYVPDEKLRTKLATNPNANTQYLRLGSGAPQQYASAMEFGLSMLDHLAEGRFALRDNVVTLSGVARTEQSFVQATESVAADMPSGLVLARAEILAPRAEIYQWSAQKNADGSVVLTGMVPDPASKKVLLASAGASAQSQLNYASGEPNEFQSSARTGMAFLRKLEEGKVDFDGKTWVLSGTAGNQADKMAIEADFQRQQLAAAGWSMAVAASQSSLAQAVEPLEADYAFSAVKSGDGTTIFIGQAPAEPAVQFFAALTGGNVDAVSISEGAPADFVARAEAGVRALLLMEEGTLQFAQGTWSLSGSAQDAATRESAIAALDASATGSWQTNISLVAEATAPEPVTVAAAAPTDNSAPAGSDVCAAPLAEFTARNAIRFQSGAAVITPTSTPALDQLATSLQACPEAMIHIEGHTDADGDEQLNLALSVARAEAVVSALIERGVAPKRLYAVGYGESSPIGSNETAEGKALNRRIVVKLAASP